MDAGQLPTSGVKYEVGWLTPDEFYERKRPIVDVYRKAFADPPYYRTEVDAISFSESLSRHVVRPGMRAVCAQDEQGDIVGFAYGYTSLPGQWWYEVVTANQPREFVQEWIDGSFELVELAVKPDHQGHKLGSRLHDLLLSDLEGYRKAVLSTMEVDTVAYRLYVKRGWQTIIPRFTFPGVKRPYQIMGKSV